MKNLLFVIYLQTAILFMKYPHASIASNSGYRIDHSFRWQALSHAFEECDCKTASKQPKFVCMKLGKVRESNRKRNDVLGGSETLQEIIVSIDNCANVSKPFTMGRPCPEQCPHEWVTEEFSACSKKCGRGTQTRRVKCGNRLHRGYTASNEFLCHTSLLPKPISTRTCAMIDCPPQFVTSDWSKECHALSTNTYCGIGYNVRSLGCEQTLANSNVVQSVNCSEQHRPDMFRDCYKPCPGLAFDANLMTKERRLNESGQYFLLSGQEISLDCSSIIAKCAIQHSALDANTLLSITWKFNGEFLDQNVDRGRGRQNILLKKENNEAIDDPRDGFQLMVDKFEQQLHMGRYECILSVTDHTNNNIPHLNCQQTMQFNLIHISESTIETTDYWSTKIDVEMEYTTTTEPPQTPSWYTPKQEKGGCGAGIACSSYGWLATDWSEDCFPLMRQIQPPAHANFSDSPSDDLSVMCIGSQGRFVWCSPEGVPTEHVPTSKCDPESRPTSVRQCVINSPC